MGEWLDHTLGDLLTLQRGFDLPETERFPGSFPVIASTGQVGTHSHSMVKGPGVVIGRSGSLGGGQFIRGDFWPLNTTLWVKDFKGNDVRFCYYLLKSLDLAAFNAGSGVPTLNRNHIHPHPVRTPSDVTEQRAIAHILGTLDGKIELNRRMNETLEAMAWALFKSWFVDFDPVRARAEGRDPALPKSLADFFPDSFEDSELGQLPKGWQVASLGDLCRRVAMGPFGSDIKTDNFVEVGVPVVRGKNLTNGFVEDAFVFVSDAKADQLRNSNAFPGDVVITHRGTLGQVGLIPGRSLFPRYVVSQSQMLLSINLEMATPRYVFDFLRSAAGQHALLANTSQTGVPAIARPTSSVRAIRLVAPPIEALRTFSRVVDPLYMQRDRAICESRTLAALCDTLLPRLISGKLRVKNAD